MRFVRENLPSLLAAASPYVTVNVNVPSGRAEKIKGVAVVPLGIRRYEDRYECAGGRDYELFGAPLDCSGHDEDTDCKFSDLGYITVTPVRVLCTDADTLSRAAKTEWKL